MTSIQQDTQLTDQEHADQVATDIERYAAFIRANPDIAAELLGSRTFRIFLMPGADTKSKIAAIARAGLRAGATVDKKVDDTYAHALLGFGHIIVQAYTYREEVCERVVTGTREIEVEEQDPEALAAVPTRTFTKVEEIVEWRCTPLLAAADDEAAEAEGGAR